MANRFTDTDKWKKPWFRKLKPIHKCFWQYLVDNCDHAGIWEVDFELAEVFIGATLDIEQIKKVFAKQYIELNRGKKWVISDFVSFQYKKGLNPENRAHASVIAILKKEGAYKGLTRGYQACKDMVKDKDKEKDKDKDNIYNKKFPFCLDTGFSQVFNYYLEMRAKIKRPATTRAKELVLEKLHKHDIKIAIAMLEQSIVNSWQGVFPLKPEQLTEQVRQRSSNEALKKMQQWRKESKDQPLVDPKDITKLTNGIGK